MVQIAFLTLFLGLTSGKQEVDVAVRGPAAAVELVLDGTPVARLGGPPWRTRIDLGPDLEPHELVARALDSKGQEIGRTRQILNLPRPPAEVGILLESGPKGPVGARLHWNSLSLAAPTAVSLSLDGNPVPVDDRAHAVLPAVDPAVTHVLSAEVHFSATLVARTAVGFGGGLGDEVSTELTAVPVRLRPGKKLPEVKRLQGWILVAGKAVPVAAIDRGPAQLLVVRDREARSALKLYDKPLGGLIDDEMDPRFRSEMTLGRKDQVRFLWPYAHPAAGAGLTADLFNSSDSFTAEDGGLLWLLGLILPESHETEQRLSDAVAVAGLQALGGHGPRAVLLVLGETPQDVSLFGAGAVSHYLESIRVPLAVWSLRGTKTPGPTPWGRAEDISSKPKVWVAFRHLEDDLLAQRILWIEGSHLPGEITLSPAAAEVVELVR
jgi:hypothetical protein